MSHIGLNIKKLRNKNFLSQSEFADRIGMTRGNLAQIELGNSQPTVQTIINIVTHFNISADLLLIGSEIAGLDNIQKKESSKEKCSNCEDLKTKNQQLESEITKLRNELLQCQSELIKLYRSKNKGNETKQAG